MRRWKSFGGGEAAETLVVRRGEADCGVALAGGGVEGFRRCGVGGDRAGPFSLCWARGRAGEEGVPVVRASFP